MRTWQNVKKLFEKCALGICADAIKWREGGKYHNLFASLNVYESFSVSQSMSQYVYNKSR